MNPFNRYNPDPTGRLYIDVGIEAAIYAVSNIASWKYAQEMPKLQAEANKKVLELQKQQYDKISDKQRTILKNSISTYMERTQFLLNSEMFEKAYSNVPKPAMYVPVDPCVVQCDTIKCNHEITDEAKAYVNYVNRLHEQNDLMHILSMDPRFMVTLDIQSKSVQDMTRGILPVGDVIEVLSDNAEQALMTGRIGNTKKTTARDLGISKLRIQAAGRKEFREATAWANSAVSPLGRQHDITEMMLTPQQNVNLALHQAQLIQQSLQNKNNALATAKPYRLAELQFKIQRAITKLQAQASQALLVNTHIPNYAATVVPNTNNVSGLVGAIGQAVSHANSSHFFGGPPSSQDGYQGASYSSESGYGNSSSVIDEK